MGLQNECEKCCDKKTTPCQAVASSPALDRARAIANCLLNFWLINANLAVIFRPTAFFHFAPFEFVWHLFGCICIEIYMVICVSYGRIWLKTKLAVLFYCFFMHLMCRVDLQQFFFLFAVNLDWSGFYFVFMMLWAVCVFVCARRLNLCAMRMGTGNDEDETSLCYWMIRERGVEGGGGKREG